MFSQSIFSLFAQKNLAKHLPFQQKSSGRISVFTPVRANRARICLRIAQTKKLTSFAQATHNKKRYL